MKVGLFFGSFNPIHIGHMIIANEIYEATDCKEVWFVVSPQNPLKKSENLAHEQDRYDMVNAAIADQYQFRTCDIEFRMPKPSYTVDTLTYLSENNPDKKFALIIGSDNLRTFHKWKNHEMILKHYGLIVYPRPGESGSNVIKHDNIEFVKAPLIDISATYIRKIITAGKSARYLLPTPVMDIIVKRHLYQNQQK